MVPAQALAMRGSTREVILRSHLVEVLQTRRYEYKGQWYPLSPSGIDQIVRELSALSLAEGLMPANERLYGKLALGITVTEFMPDGKKHQPTVPLVDWQTPDTNQWDAVESPELHTTIGAQTIAPHLMPKLAYDPRKDFTPVAHVANAANVVLVPPSITLLEPL